MKMGTPMAITSNDKTLRNVDAASSNNDMGDINFKNMQVRGYKKRIVFFIVLISFVILFII